jgi:hypothetical protein
MQFRGNVISGINLYNTKFAAPGNRRQILREKVLYSEASL